MTKKSRVAVIVVTYNCDLIELEKILGVSSATSLILVIDNGSHNQSELSEFIQTYSKGYISKINLTNLEENFGLAYAQNIGISKAMKSDCDYVLLLDQDSEPEPDMILHLLEAESKLQRQGNKVAAVGPCYVDPRQLNPPPFIALNGLKLKRYQCKSEEEIHRVDYLIASGSLINCEVLQDVGLMKESFFIDYIDIEWGLRAKFKGYQSFGVCKAKMRHQLGDKPIFFFKKKIPVHSPLRHYYHVRNAIVLYQEKWVPNNWKLVDGYKLCLKVIFYSLVTKPRLQHLKMMLLGIVHGLIGTNGKLRKKD